MSKPTRQSKRRSGATFSRRSAGDSGRVQESRIDPPHEVATPWASNAAELSEVAAAGSAPGSTGADPPAELAVGTETPALQPTSAAEVSKDRIQMQADQLAVHLRARQREIDHRESQVNARLAALDRDMRVARLWLQEREAELANRSDSLDQREASLDKRERELQPRSAPALHSAADELETRRQEIDRIENRVQEARAEAESLRQQLREAHEQLGEEARQQRQRLAAEHRDALAEIQKQQQSLRRRGEHVDQCHAALEQLRAELGRMHREALEIRLATEELWVQLSGAAPPAALTRSLSGIRSKLADHYRLANAELHEQKQELESIRQQLSTQYDKVVQQKRTYDRWTQQHRQEAEADASRLAAREAELRQLQAELDDRALQWKSQRLDFEQQIRRLKAQSRGYEPITA